MLHCHRFLAQVWEFSHAQPLTPRRRCRSGRRRGRPERRRRASRPETRPSTCGCKLAQWCEAAVEKITEDMESLEMHSAVRDVMRLFDRIKDFEKRVLARQPAAEPRPTARR